MSYFLCRNCLCHIDHEGRCSQCVRDDDTWSAGSLVVYFILASAAVMAVLVIFF